MLSQAASRAAKRKQKDTDLKSDEKNARGFSTDQQISMIGINTSKQRLMHQQNEQKLVAMSIEATALQNQIESAERRAEHRCAEHNKHDANWKIVDDLLDQQNKVNEMIRQHNMKLMMSEGNPWTATEFSDTWKDNSEIKKKPEVEVTKKARVEEDSIVAEVDIESEIIATAKKYAIVLDMEEAGASAESDNDDDELKSPKFAMQFENADGEEEAFCNEKLSPERKEEPPSPERKEESPKSPPAQKRTLRKRGGASR